MFHLLQERGATTEQLARTNSSGSRGKPGQLLFPCSMHSVEQITPDAFQAMENLSVGKHF